jgi:DNA polymerase type B, organellar and viral
MKRYESFLTASGPSRWPYKVVIVDCAEVEESEVDGRGSHVPTLGSWTAIMMRRSAEGYDYHGTATGATAADWYDRLRKETESSRSLLIISAKSVQTWAMLAVWSALESGELQITPDGYDHQNPMAWAAKQLEADAKRRVSNGKRSVSTEQVGAGTVEASEDAGEVRLRGRDRDAQVRHDENAPRSHSCGGLRRYLSQQTGYLVMSAPPMIAKLKLRGTECWITWVDVGNYGISIPEGTVRGHDAASWIAGWWKRWYSACSEYRLGSWKPTIGGQAYEGWRSGHFTAGTAVTLDRTAVPLAQSAYIGGRAEAYCLGAVAGTVYYLDIRAAYCHRCRIGNVPTRLLRAVANCDTVTAGTPASDECCIALVTLETDRPYYPYRLDNITVWPVGRFRTTLCGAELKRACDLGHIAAWHSWCEYECSPALAAYADAVYQLRCECDERHDAEMATCSKLLCNTIVGKLAGRQKDWIPHVDPDNDVLWGEYHGVDAAGNQQLYRSLGGQVQRQEESGYCAGSIPEMAAWITAACRMQLLDLILCAGKEHVYYADTDAVMCDSVGRERLIAAGHYRPHCIGFVGERWVSESVEIRGVKDYEHDGIVVCAGIRDGDKRIHPAGGRAEHVLSPQEELRRRQKPSGKSVIRNYHRESEYRHGTVLSNGRIVPLVIHE